MPTSRRAAQLRCHGVHSKVHARLIHMTFYSDACSSLSQFLQESHLLSPHLRPWPTRFCVHLYCFDMLGLRFLLNHKFFEPFCSMQCIPRSYRNSASLNNNMCVPHSQHAALCIESCSSFLLSSLSQPLPESSCTGTFTNMSIEVTVLSLFRKYCVMSPTIVTIL